MLRLAPSIHGLAEELNDFFERGLAELFPFALQALTEANGRILHFFVGFSRAADQKEMFAVSNPLVFVFIVQTDAQEAQDFGVVRPFLGGHPDNSS
jgi:hypothetical protein